MLMAMTAILALLLGGCQASVAPMNQPLAGTAPNSNDVWDANAAGGRADTMVLVSFSGGGKRSAAFGHGALRGMRDLRLPGGSSLLSEIDVVTGVSGGSFPSSHFALNGERTFETFPQEFLNQDIESWIYGTYLLPWNWDWLASPYTGTNDRMAQVYDRLMFRGATFGDLQRRGRPHLSVNTTDLSYGTPFAFTPRTFDLICSNLATFPLARAVAASNGFPGVFTPITIENFRDPNCRLPPPRDVGELAAAGDRRSRMLAASYGRYLSTERTRWLHLMDGGISDNLAMRHTANTLVVMENDLQNSSSRLRSLRRILVISIDGEASSDPTLPQRRVVSGLFNILGTVSGGQIDSYNAETLLLVDQQLGNMAASLRRVRCSEARTIDGARCDDVKVGLVHIALANYPDAEARQRLLAIRTGLTIPPEDVQQLLHAGESMVAREAGLAAFLADIDAPRVAATARR